MISPRPVRGAVCVYDRNAKKLLREVSTRFDVALLIIAQFVVEVSDSLERDSALCTLNVGVFTTLRIYIFPSNDAQFPFAAETTAHTRLRDVLDDAVNCCGLS